MTRALATLAATSWDEVDADKSGRFDLVDVEAALLGKIDFKTMGEDLVATAVRGAVHNEDKRRNRAGQLSLLEGEEDDDYAQLGGGTRVRRSVMVLDDVNTESAIEAASLQQHAASFASNEAVRGTIRRYMSNPLTTWAEARDEYRRESE